MENIDDIKQALQSFLADTGRMPSYSEICEIFGYKSKNAAFRLVKKLIDLGLVEKSIKGKLIPKGISQPLQVLGQVQAGFPTHADSMSDTLSLDQFLISKPGNTYALTVSGDSMIDEGIREGDLVIVEKTESAKKGDIVVAFIDNEWTLKFYDKKDGQVCLVPGNKNYPILYPKYELKIGGVVTSVVRKYK